MTVQHDLFILIPGITGSVLTKGGRDLWAPTLGALAAAAWSHGANLSQLILPADDDPKADDLDGVEAPAIIAGVTIVPGLHKFNGFDRLRSYLLKERLPLDPGSLIAFPYDWRRDNRVAARKLGRLVDERLGQIRAAGAPEARTVLIAHSMGGLVARYYLEVLGGWRNCRALITFGTPHRGSVKSLDFLANEQRVMKLVNLTDFVRSCTSAYQLLPIYRMFESAGGWHRVAEVPDLPNVDQKRAQAGREFHDEIKRAQAENSENPEYSKKGYLMLPVVGRGQPTLQSARIENGRLVADRSLPIDLESLLGDGDGTVPHVSAIPFGVTPGRDPMVFATESHSGLPGQEEVLDQVIPAIQQLGLNLEKFLGPPTPTPPTEGISVEVADAYPAGESVVVAVRALGLADLLREMIARLEPLTDGASPTSLTLLPTTDGGWTASASGLAAGSYRLAVEAKGATGPLASVTDLFEVI